MNVPSDLHYTSSHEWLKVEGNNGTIGITDYAQGELGDIVYVSLPEIGAPVHQGTPFGSIDAVKAAVDIYAPVSGEVIAVNTLLEQTPELINKSPYADGWIIKIKISDPAEISTLLNPTDYANTAASHG